VQRRVAGPVGQEDPDDLAGPEDPVGPVGPETDESDGPDDLGGQNAAEPEGQNFTEPEIASP
jgi:hypothetical protein